MQSVRECVYGRRRRRPGEKKYDEIGGQHDRPAALRQRGSMESDGRSGSEPRDPAPSGDAMRDHGADRASLQPALEELKRQAAQAEVVHNDDTSMRVLSLDRDADISPERTGVFTSGLVWMAQKRRIALYFTGCKHAGENLAEVLKLRSPDLPPIHSNVRCPLAQRAEVVCHTAGQLFDARSQKLCGSEVRRSRTCSITGRNSRCGRMARYWVGRQQRRVILRKSGNCIATVSAKPRSPAACKSAAPPCAGFWADLFPREIGSPDSLRSLTERTRNVRRAFYKQITFLAANLHHPSLHAKKYDEPRGIWQARVNKDWRFYFIIAADTYIVLDVIPHPK